jgi:hypothetical protein
VAFCSTRTGVAARRGRKSAGGVGEVGWEGAEAGSVCSEQDKVASFMTYRKVRLGASQGCWRGFRVTRGDKC